jgi:hypothetical protein
MPWAKLDDRFHTNPKVLKVWTTNPAALGLHALAMSYCAGEQTDGMVPEAFLMLMMPTTKARAEAIRTLTDAGLWKKLGEAYVIHDWLEYNPSRASVEARSRERREAGRKGAAKRWGDS